LAVERRSRPPLAAPPQRLLATTVDGQPLSSVVSSTFTAAAFFDGTDRENPLSCPG
jgi:hypothetical protein